MPDLLLREDFNHKGTKLTKDTKKKRRGKKNKEKKTFFPFSLNLLCALSLLPFVTLW
jgi:hypothetical protein